jgi:hypothetical protein
MATIYGTSIITSGLVLCLDASNPKSLLKTVEVLVVAGGGGGGFEMGGGGGAGGVIYNSAFPVTSATIVTVGAGGSGRTSNADNTANAGNSTFSTLTAIAGGAGGNNSATYDGTATGGRPTSGGSGGGNGEGQTLAPGTSGQGNAGGAAIEAGIYHSGGGGGAGSPGSAGTASGGGNGGIGLLYSISGTPTYYGGGGGGGVYLSGTPGQGGLGGGGAAGAAGNAGVAGTANRGGGGGGGSYSPSSVGGAGGSGIVIVRYFGPAQATGGTITSVGGYTIHTFTSVGSSTFTPNPTWINTAGRTANAFIRGTSTVVASYNGAVYTPLSQTTTYVELPESILQALPNGLTWTMEIAVTIPDASQFGTRYGPHMTVSGGNDFIWQWNATDSNLYASTLASGTNPTWTVNVPLILTLTRNDTSWKVFKNGVFSAEYTLSTTNTTAIQGWILDQEADGLKGGFDANQNLSALWHRVSFYSRILSNDEILQNFNVQKVRFGL